MECIVKLSRVNPNPAALAEPNCEVGLMLARGEICGASSATFDASGLALYEFRYIGGTALAPLVPKMIVHY